MIKSSKRAFTLAELLLAAAIMAFALTTLLSLFSNCILLNTNNRDLTLAASHAQLIMEQIADTKNTNFNNVMVNINNGYWNWDIARISSSGLTPLKSESIAVGATGTETLDIVVTVSWQEQLGRNRSMVLETLMTRP